MNEEHFDKYISMIGAYTMHKKANFDIEYLVKELKRIDVELTDNDLSEIIMYDALFRFIHEHQEKTGVK